MDQIALQVRGLADRWRWFWPVLLMTLILLRLVWSQLRTYHVEVDYRTNVSLGYMHLLGSERCPGIAIAGYETGVADFLQMKNLMAQPAYQWFRSSLFESIADQACSSQQSFRVIELVKFNHWLFIGIVILAAALVRLLTSSWVIALAAAAVLLSRGHLIASIGDIGLSNTLSFFVLAALSGYVHFCFSGSWFTFIVALIWACIAAYGDFALLSVLLTFPAFLLLGFSVRRAFSSALLQRLRTERRQILNRAGQARLGLFEGGIVSESLAAVLHLLVKEADTKREQSIELEEVQQKRLVKTGPSAGFFQHLRQPFAFWIRNRHRLLRVLMGTTLALALMSVVVVSEKLSLREFLLNQHGLRDFLKLYLHNWAITWVRGLTEPIDLHLFISMLLVCVTALQSPAKGLRHVFEASWLVIVAIVLTVICCFFADVLDFWLLYSIEGSLGDWSILAWGRSTRIFVWFEPCILAMGIVSFYQLIVTGGQRSKKVRQPS